MPTFSIVIPYYNTPKELFESCIGSLVSQKYKDYEVIVVNDGSDIKHSELCEKIVKDLRQARYYLKKNEGVSEARNFGIKKSKGKYILFLDSDDKLSEDYLLEVNKNIQELGGEVVLTSLLSDYARRQDKTIKVKTAETIVARSFFGDDITKYPDHYTCKNAVFKKEIASKNSFDSCMKYGEDTLFLLECMKGAKIATAPNAYYEYVKNTSSAMNIKEIDTIEKYLDDSLMLAECMKKEGFEEKRVKNLEYVKLYNALSMLPINNVKYSAYKRIAQKVKKGSIKASALGFGVVKKIGIILLSKRCYGLFWLLLKTKELIRWWVR